MTKFEEALVKLESIKSVADSIQYDIDAAESSANSYKERATAELAEGETLDEDNYWVKESKKYKAKVDVFKELLEYLEKKYLK